MSETKWPAPMLAPMADVRDKLVLHAVEGLRLDPVFPHSKLKPTGRRERIAYVKNVLRYAAEDLIPMAEALIGATGPEKKALVKKEMMALLKLLEARVNLVPGPLEGLAWWAVERAVDGIIEEVFRRLEARGIVNA